MLATSTLTLKGQINYTTTSTIMTTPIPTNAIPAVFTQDQSGQVALNSQNPPRARLDIVTNSNLPALVVDQQGTGTIAEFFKTGVKKTVIDGNGNVGIGTHTPLFPLTVIGTPNITASFQPLGGSVSNVSTLRMYSTFGNFPTDTGPRYSARITSGFQDLSTGIWGSEYLAFGVGNNGSANDAQIDPLEKIRITCNGNVGIGTTLPKTTLHVNGNLLALPPYLLIEDQKANATSGGTASSGWQTRTLNTIVTDTIGIGSLSANTFTLPAGTYEVIASAPAYMSGRHRIRLYNVTSSTTVLLGTSEYNNNVSGYAETRSHIESRITLSSSTQLRIDHYIGIANANANALGVETSSGDVEIYTRVKIIRLA
jgi:hypothetical protein